jgi:hypothetical protein
MLKDAAFLEGLRAERFDVGLSEAFDVCAFAIYHLLGIKTTISTTAVVIYPSLAFQFGIPNPIPVLGLGLPS